MDGAEPVHCRRRRRHPTGATPAMLDLPLETIEQIVLRVDHASVGCMAQTCRALRDLLTNDGAMHERMRRAARRFDIETLLQPAGRLVREVFFVLPNGRWHGTFERWNDAGIRVSLDHWVNGVMHGTSERWNDAGIRVMLTHWVNGIAHGAEEWNDVGIRTRLIDWGHGKQHGTEERWDDAGARTRLVFWVTGGPR